MHTTMTVSRFVTAAIEASGKTQALIAREAGFDRPRALSAIKHGRAQLPLGKIGGLAKSLGCDPIELTRLCMSEYFPETWDAIAPYLDDAFTADELALIRNMRRFVGTPYLTALNPRAQKCLNEFFAAARASSVVH